MKKNNNKEKKKNKILVYKQVEDFMNREFNVPDWYYKLREVYRNIFCDFWHKLKRSTKWFFFMWNNCDWDYSSLYKIMDKKMEALEKSIRNGYHSRSKKYAKIISIARWYLQRIIKDDYVKAEEDKLEKDYGYAEPVYEKTDNPNISILKGSKYSKCMTETENKIAERRSDEIRDLYWKRREEYKKKFFDILNKYVERWWN